MNDTLLAMTAEIVIADAQNGARTAAEMGDLIKTVYGALASCGEEGQAHEPATPRKNWKNLIEGDYIVSLEDGKRYKSMKSHLRKRGLTPEQYRSKHGLPHDFPMVSASYSAARSDLAKKMGLGKKAGA